MALFESYERRIDQINACLKEYGISSIEECKEITLAKGVDCDKIVRETQPICFENAVWAYTVGCAIAIKTGSISSSRNNGPRRVFTLRSVLFLRPSSSRAVGSVSSRRSSSSCTTSSTTAKRSFESTGNCTRCIGRTT